jgi:hypothetical protein
MSIQERKIKDLTGSQKQNNETGGRALYKQAHGQYNRRLVDPGGRVPSRLWRDGFYSFGVKISKSAESNQKEIERKLSTIRFCSFILHNENKKLLLSIMLQLISSE